MIGTATSSGSASSGLTSTSAPSTSPTVISAITVSGTANRTALRQRVHVPRGPGEQIAGAGPLHRGQRDGEHPVDEVLAQPASTRSPSRAEASTAKRTSTACTTTNPAIVTASRSTTPAPRPCWMRLDEVAEQARADQPGDRGEHVQADRDGQGARVAAEEVARVPPDLGGRRPPASALPLIESSRRTVRAYRGSAVEQARGGCPRRPRRPARRRARGRPGPAPAGCVEQTTVVRPRRAAPSRSAIRASVCASTALVGSTRIERSPDRRPAHGPAAAAAAGRRRSSRPRSATTLSRPSGSASTMSSAAAAAQRGRRPGRSPPDPDPTAAAPENSRASLSATRIRSRTVARSRSLQRYAGQRRVAVRVDSGRAGRRSRPRRPGAAATIAVSRPGRIGHAGRRIDQLTAGPAARCRTAGSGRSVRARSMATTRRLDTWPRVSLSSVSVSWRSGRDQERRVRVEGDQLPDGDLRRPARTGRPARSPAPGRRPAAAPGRPPAAPRPGRSARRPRAASATRRGSAPDITASPPTPRSTRRPPTRSAARPVSRPCCSRYACWPRCSGRISRPTTAISSGTPSTTTRPSGTEVTSRMTVTATIATSEPVPRAVMSIAPPMWLMSAVPIATTSPVSSRRGSADPSRFGLPDRHLDGAERRGQPVEDGEPVPADPGDRLHDARRPSSTRLQNSRSPASRAVSPASIARPTTAGTSAWQSIQSDGEQRSPR